MIASPGCYFLLQIQVQIHLGENGFVGRQGVGVALDVLVDVHFIYADIPQLSNSK